MAANAEWLGKDYYDLLGVPGTATDKEVRRAYHRLARRLHPDTGEAGDAERFRAVAAAYEVLGNAEKRREYDEVRRLVRSGPGPGHDWTRGRRVRVTRRPTVHPTTSGSDDLFGGDPRGGGNPSGADPLGADSLGADPFGRDPLGGVGFGGPVAGTAGRNRGTGAGRTRVTARPRRGADAVAEVTLDPAEAVRGSTRQIGVVDEVPCPACDGSGLRPGTSTGCDRCSGGGMTAGHRVVTARIPAGVQDGGTVRLRGRGAPGRDGGPPGDLRVRVHVSPHPFLGRQGRDLTVTVPVTFAEAALGADVRVPALDGPVTVRVPPGTQPGTVLRVRGRGVPARDGPGDLLVTVQVDVPRQLSDGSAPPCRRWPTPPPTTHGPGSASDPGPPTDVPVPEEVSPPCPAPSTPTAGPAGRRRRCSRRSRPPTAAPIRR